MNKVYTRINWENYPSLVTPINEQNLNKLDFATDSLDNRIINLDTAKVNVSDIQKNISDWAMDEETGIITVTRVNGDTITFDLNIEKIPVDFKLTSEGVLIMTTDDGTQFSADIASMIPVLTFETSDEIKVDIKGEGINKIYSFSIIDKSIGETKLQSNYLADIKEETAKSKNYSDSASNSAKLSKSYAVGGTGTRENEDVDNAKYYAEIAQNMINDETSSDKSTYSSNKINTLIEDVTPGIDLTQSEYDALPDTKYTDNVTYYITDGNDTFQTDSNIIHDEITKESTHSVVEGLKDRMDTCEENISELNSNLSKLPYTSISGNTINISQYNTNDNYYTLPSDGFIRLSCTVASTSAKATLHVMSDNGSWLILSRAIANGSDSVDTLNYFPKGTKVYIDGTSYNGLFIPVNK